MLLTFLFIACYFKHFVCLSITLTRINTYVYIIYSLPIRHYFQSLCMLVCTHCQLRCCSSMETLISFSSLFTNIQSPASPSLLHCKRLAICSRSLNGGASKFAGKAHSHSHSHVRLCSSALFSCVIAVNDSSATLQTAAVLLAPAHASRSRSLKGLHARARLLDPLHAYEMIDIETRYIHVIYLLMTSMCCHKN